MTLVTSRRQPAKLKADRIGLRRAAMFPKERSRPEVGRVVLWSVVRAENHGSAPPSMPKAPLSPLFRAFCGCPAFPGFRVRGGEAKYAPNGVFSPFSWSRDCVPGAHVGWSDMLTTFDAFLLGFPALISILSPLNNSLVFRAITSSAALAERAALAGRVSLYSLFVMLLALWLGAPILGAFGVSLAALRVAGGLIIAAYGWDLLRTGDPTEDSADSADGQHLRLRRGAADDPVDRGTRHHCGCNRIEFRPRGIRTR